MNRNVLAVASLILIVMSSTLARATGCAALTNGQHIFLKSSDLDPDVFVWDSRVRVIEYSAGHWKNTTDVMNHTVLSKPGTRAVIVQCEKNVVHSKFANEILDAVGIKIVAGPNRGHYGWVTSEDVYSSAKTAELRTR